MSRIAARFSELARAGRRALVPFITAGDPRPPLTVALMHRLVESGADIIELGVPFSDPMAEGPAIQRACERALAHGVTLRGVLDTVRAFRERDGATPLVLMGYLNPVEVMGYERFAREAAAAGADGVITVDLPPEEAGPYLAALEAAALDPIFLLSPTTTERRAQMICEASRGFVYYVSLRGVTGATHIDLAEVERRVQGIRARAGLPVGVGFGIHGPEAAARVAAVADAVIVGSAIVKRIEAAADDEARLFAEVGDFLSALRRAIDSVRVTSAAGTA